MPFSTWLSRQLFSIIDSDRGFEEMDRMILEEKMLENQESEEGSMWMVKCAVSSVAVAVGGVTIVTRTNSDVFGLGKWTLPCVGAALILAVGCTLSIGSWWGQRRVRSIREVINQLERTKKALRKRRQVYFSVSMRIPRHRHPLILRACRIVVSLIECLVEKTLPLNNGSTWQDLYTDEIRQVVQRSSENPGILRIEELEEDEELDFEAIYESLIAVFKLHASEYSRVVILDFLGSSKFDFRKLRSFLRTCGSVREFAHELERIEGLALKREVEKPPKTTRKNKDVDIGWRQQTSMALEAIMEALDSENVDRSEVELSLHKILVMVGAEKNASKSESPEKVQPATVQDSTEGMIIRNKERTDVDMVFEGVPLSEADKLAASKSAVARDVLLDGSEGRRHEASLFGELQMILEPRRVDFAKRERTALAKFYGVEESQLEVEGEKEETFEGVGAGGDEDPEPYDWRKDAETSAGIHREADNDDFLKALNLRRVEDDIIE